MCNKNCRSVKNANTIAYCMATMSYNYEMAYSDACKANARLVDELKRTKRALWLDRERRADERFHFWCLLMCLNRKCNIDGEHGPNTTGVMRDIKTWMLMYDAIKNKCKAMADKYMDDYNTMDCPHKFIPMSMRTPESNGQYLVYTMNKTCFIANYDIVDKKFCNANTSLVLPNNYVTHWAYMPDEPTED